MDIEVVNIKNAGDNGYYIGRPSILRNRFVIGSDGTREEVIAKFRSWLWAEMQKGDVIFNEMLKLMNMAVEGDLVLTCWCKPKACHGDVIRNALNYLIHETEL